MKQQTHVVKRGGAFQFRLSVPADLVGHYGPKSGDIRKSLGKDRAVAMGEGRRLVKHFQDEFEKARRLLAVPAVPLTADLMPLLTAALRCSVSLVDEEARRGGRTPEELEQRRAEVTDQLASLRSAYARGDSSSMRSPMLDWLHRTGFDDVQDPVVHQQLQHAMLEARLEALQGVAKRLDGDVVPVPEADTEDTLRALVEARAMAFAPGPETPRRATAGPRLQDVVDYWKGTGDKTERTKSSADTQVREFIALHGDLPLQDIEKGHFVALRDHLLKRVTPATVQARFNLLRAAFRVCLEDDQWGLKVNPLEFVKIRGITGEKTRDAFKPEQLQTLFASEVFTKGARPVGGRGETAFWLPLLALFTGARLDELVQLRDDGVYEWEGVPVIHFRHRPAMGQNLKGRTKNNRRVPVHPELIRLGFLEYAHSVKARGVWLFPDIDRSEKRRSLSSAWGAWFGRYLDSIGITDKQLTFHSFRHTFKHFCRASEVPEDHHDAMTGHTTPEVARRYGSAEGYPIGPLQRSVEALRFSSLDLSGIGPRLDS